MTQEQIQVSDPEKEQLLQFFKALDRETLRATADAISMFVRAFEGRPVGDEDVITRLINVKNKMETSRFPTYPLLAKQVYLRLIAKYNPSAKACREWADYESEALKAYKGLNWDAYVEMTKNATAPSEQQQFYFNAEKLQGPIQPLQAQQQGKKHFWRKQPKQNEPSEFESQ